VDAGNDSKAPNAERNVNENGHLTPVIPALNMGSVDTEEDRVAKQIVAPKVTELFPKTDAKSSVYTKPDLVYDAAPVSVGPFLVSIETIAPDAAKALLTKNKNRRLRPKSVAKYVGQMTAGLWRVGPCLMFTSAGELVDGQHRLTAIVKSGVAAQFLIVRGVPRELFEVIDQGSGRDTGDALRTALGIDDDRCVGAIVRASITRNQSVTTVPYVKISPKACVAHFEKHRDTILHLAQQWGTRRAPAAVIGCSVAGVIDRAASLEEMARLAARFRMEDFSGKGDPLYLLQKNIMTRTTAPTAERYAFAVSAIAAALRGDRLSKLRPSTRDWLESPGTKQRAAWLEKGGAR
jgi:hypothetical protein